MAANMKTSPAVVMLGKALRRHSRDFCVALRLSLRVRTALCLSISLIIFLLFFLLALLPARSPFSISTCGCPADAKELLGILHLAHTALVARVGRRGSLHPLAVLRGPPGAAAHPLQIPPHDIVSCGELSLGSSALVLLGPLARAADANASAPTAPVFSCARVWAAPWEAWRSALAPHEASGSWWRTHSVERDLLWRDAVASAAAPATSRPPLASRAEWWLRDGVTVVAACMDRSDTLRTAAASWFAAHGVAEVVLVDWTSSTPALHILPRPTRSDPRLVVVRVEGQKQWVLSRAYNLGIQIASRNTVLKADCDTLLHPDFIKRHPLRSGEFYAGDWRALRTPLSEHLHVNGLLLARRDDLLAVGAYDERITTYGWDDSDVAERIASTREHLRFDYSSVEHIPHPATLRIAHQGHSAILPPGHPHAAAVEIQRNRILLTRCNLAAWRTTSPRTVWDIELRSTQYARSGGGVFGFSAAAAPASTPTLYVASAASEVSSATELISESDAQDVAKRAIRVVLSRYGVPTLPKTLTLGFYKRLITKVAYPQRYAEVALSLRGGCLARFLAHSAAIAATSGHDDSASGVMQLPSKKISLFDDAAHPPPKGYFGWRMRHYWSFPSQECKCRFYDAFDAIHSEISSIWSDENPKSQFRAYRAGVVPTNVRDVLSTYNTHAEKKKIPLVAAEWTNTSSATHQSSRILMAQLSCDVAPQNASAAHSRAIREVLRELAPAEPVRIAVLNSLRTPIRTLLDAPELHNSAWPELVGSAVAKNVTTVLSDSTLRTMEGVWGVKNAVDLRFQLHDRAGALVVAMELRRNSERWRTIGAGFDEHRLKAIEAVVDELERRFKKLFEGCPDHPSQYLEAYPELAMVVAGLLSANFCMS